jgi:hypothetical protein
MPQLLHCCRLWIRLNRRCSSQNKATLQVEHCGRAEVPSANPEAGTRRYRSPRDCMRLLEAHVCS